MATVLSPLATAALVDAKIAATTTTVTATIGGASATLTLTKSGGLVHAYANWVTTNAYTQAAAVVLFNLPVGYRPGSTHTFLPHIVAPGSGANTSNNFLSATTTAIQTAYANFTIEASKRCIINTTWPAA